MSNGIVSSIICLCHPMEWSTQCEPERDSYHPGLPLSKLFGVDDLW